MNDTRRPLMVFGDDGKEPAHTAWRWITNQPWPDWHIDVLTADEDKPVDWGSPPRPDEWQPSWDRTEPVEGVADLRFVRVAADPRAFLTEQEGVDLLVVGLRTHSYLRGLVTGSTTEWLLHHPPAPMVVAGCHDPVERAVVCVDGSEHASSALEAFADLPLAAACRVTVLAVDDGRSDAEQALAAGAAALQGRVAEVDTSLRSGTPTPEILDHLDENRPELVVLGTRGMTGWQRLRLGSTAAAVVRSAPCTSLVGSAETR